MGRSALYFRPLRSSAGDIILLESGVVLQINIAKLDHVMSRRTSSCTVLLFGPFALSFHYSVDNVDLM